MIEPVELRPARRADVSRLQQIEVAAGELFRRVGLDRVADDPPPTTDLLDRHICEGTAWVAATATTVVGYALASIVDGDGHVDQVSVDPAAAGNRIGEQLIDVIDRWAASRGAPAVTLTTFRDVPWNGPYYRRLGFEDIADVETGPALRQIRDDELAAGLDVAPRVAMRRPTRAPRPGR